MCLREQLRLLRLDSEQNKQQLIQMQNSLRKSNIWFGCQRWDKHLFQILWRSRLAIYLNPQWRPRLFLRVTKNLKWAGLGYIYEHYAKTKFRNSGYMNAFNTGGSQYVAFSESSATISVEDPNQVFDVVSLETCAARADNVELTITGWRSGVRVHTHTWKLLLGKLQHIHLHWTSIDTLLLQSSKWKSESWFQIQCVVLYINCTDDQRSTMTDDYSLFKLLVLLTIGKRKGLLNQ